ncbi:MAG: PaaI family thioesterase [Solirubrobacteraceae bacterium]|nr:PaaI family thioesterase [Solirubrobacteraceae bacterium]
MSETSASFQWTTQEGEVIMPTMLPPEQTLDGTLGVQVQSATTEEVVCFVDIDHRHQQPFGLLHGGVYALVAESAASIGGALTAIPKGGGAVGMSNNTAFLRPFSGKGRLTSTARRIHGGRTTQLWDIEHRDDRDRLCASSRVTIALLPPQIDARD